MAEVKLENITKVFPGGLKAVDNMNLTVGDQEFIVLVGPSGCGKTTTLRMVAGLEEITSGTIRIGDRVVNDLPPKDRDIAMVFQNYALYPHMTVYDNMAFGLKLRGMPRGEIDQRVRWAAGILGLMDVLDRKPRALSGGQRQRVAVGRAIVRHPKAFLFDEPLSNLDAKLRVETRAELKRLHQRLQTTTIYVTHDQEEAMTLGDRVVVMDAGIVQQVDTPLNTYRRPLNRFVAGFLGTPPMNFFDGRIIQADGALWFDGCGLRITMPAGHARCLESWAGRSVVVGVRPEALRLRRAEPATSASTVQVRVNVVEPLGSHIDIYGQTVTDARIVARVPAESDLVGVRELTFHLDMQHIHVFEPGTYGGNLTLPAVT